MARKEPTQAEQRQALEDVAEGRATLVNGVWRLGGKPAPWNAWAKRELRGVGVAVVRAHKCRVEEAERAVRDEEHWLAWNADRVCDGCDAPHTISEWVCPREGCGRVRGLGGECRRCGAETAERLRHVPHIVDGVDRGLHHFHVSAAECQAGRDRLSAARQALIQRLADQDAFCLKTADANGARAVHDAVGSGGCVLLTHALCEMETGRPMAAEGKPLTLSLLSEFLERAEHAVAFHEKNAREDEPRHMTSKEDSREALPEARDRLVVLRWLRDHAAGRLSA